MKSIVRVSSCCCGFSLWVFYACLQLRHFYDTAVLVPPTVRTVRDMAELRLPRLYFCPADRGRVTGFRWRSFECLLTYKDDHTTCPARIQGYKGRTPETFSADGHSEGKKGGECLEFGTHMIGVRREESAAWNEISLRASFDPGTGPGAANMLQEAELGYLPAAWDLGSEASTFERFACCLGRACPSPWAMHFSSCAPPARFYYPLLRVPIFYLDSTARHSDGYWPPSSFKEGGAGVATRTYLGKEVDRGRVHGGRYWYTYGAMQLAVENVTMPSQNFLGADHSGSPRVGIMHVVITLEDFEEFDFQVISCFFPFLQLLGHVAGVGALMLWIFADSPRERSPKASSSSISAGGGGAEGDRGRERRGSDGFSAECSKDEVCVWAANLDEEGGEDEALLGTEAPKRRNRIGEETGAGQSLLGGTEGGDGL